MIYDIILNVEHKKSYPEPAQLTGSSLRRNIHGSEGFRSEINYTCGLFFFQSDMLKKDDRKDDRVF